MPISSVVTPWRSLISCRGSDSSTRSEWECMSMKPGTDDALSRTSMVRAGFHAFFAGPDDGDRVSGYADTPAEPGLPGAVD